MNNQLLCWQDHPAVELGGFVGCATEGCRHKKAWAVKTINLEIRWNEALGFGGGLKCKVCGSTPTELVFCTGTVKTVSTVSDGKYTNLHFKKKPGTKWCIQLTNKPYYRCQTCVGGCPEHQDLKGY